MPRRSDLHRILVIGSGPIVIGQGARLDYAGPQATKALKEEGYEVILVNSNPATIMTDPEFADRTYIEPVTAEYVELVIAKERPDALLPTMGGQTALNVAMKLAENGVLEKYGVELIGADARAIAMAEAGSCSAKRCGGAVWPFRRATPRPPWTRRSRSLRGPRSRRSYGRRSRLAAPVVGSRTTGRS